MRGRPHSLILAAAAAGALAGAAAVLPGVQVQASAIERRMPSDPPETMRRRIRAPWQKSSRKGDPGRPKKHRRRRPPRAWRRARAAKLRSRK